MFREGRQFLKKTKYKTSTQLMERMKKRVNTGLNAFFHLEPHIFEQMFNGSLLAIAKR